MLQEACFPNTCGHLHSSRISVAHTHYDNTIVEMEEMVGQPPGWDLDWPTIMDWQYDSVEYDFGMVNPPYDCFCGETADKDLVDRDASTLRALAAEAGLLWSATTALGEYNDILTRKTHLVWVENAVGRVRWAWEAADGAVRVEASVLLGRRVSGTGLGPDLPEEEGYCISIRDARPSEGPFFALVVTQGDHPCYVSSALRIEDSHASACDGLLDEPPLDPVGQAYGRTVPLAWQAPYVPGEVLARMTAPNVILRAVTALLRYSRASW